MTKKKTLSAAVLTFALAAYASSASAEWVVETSIFGSQVINHVTKEQFKAVNEKAARKQAKILNKIEKRQKKSYKPDADGRCGETDKPGPGILC